MRTEDDLRAALTALESHAPAAARVLPGSEPRRSGHGLRSPRTIRLLSGIATAAALAGVVAVLALPGGPHAAIPNGGVASSSGATNVITLRARLLAAISAASNDIAYRSSTSLNTGESPIVVESWSYPSQPRPGQLVRIRTLTYNLSGTLHYDDEATFVLPASANSPVPSRTIPLGHRVIVDYVGKTYSDQDNTPVPEGAGKTSSALITYYKAAHWTVRRTTLNGRAALELSFKDASRSNPSTVNVWVDAATYLPLRETDIFGPPGMSNSTTVNDAYLPPTSANFAKLAVPIPRGFRRVEQ